MNVISIGILFCTAPSIPSTRTSKNGKYVARDMFEYLCQQQYVSVYNIINKIKNLLILFAFYHSLYLRLLMETPANTDYSCHDIAHKNASCLFAQLVLTRVHYVMIRVPSRHFTVDIVEFAVTRVSWSARPTSTRVCVLSL